MTNFADILVNRFSKLSTVLCAGIDPNLETLPRFIREQVAKDSKTDDDFIYQVLTQSFIPSLEAISSHVAACKPNIAFFEQYGLPGLRAYSDILSCAKRLGLPSIVDAKRGDIGSTAQAYSNAFLGGTKVLGHKYTAFEADSLTVNPYLGADTLEVFASACEAYGKGIFVLVRTSNPGSNWLQADCVQKSDNHMVSQRVAEWINERGENLKGDLGISSLGAVVGATYPEEAKLLRRQMSNNLFLIPGFGAQGGTAQDASSGFASNSFSKCAATVNVSRGLFSVFTQDLTSTEDMQKALVVKATNLNNELNVVFS